MSKYILGIDQGTTSSRVVIFDENVDIVSVSQQEITCYYPKPGWVEQDANEIYQSVVSCMKNALEKANLSLSDISGIGITNQRETTIVWDKTSGEPVYHALVWQSRQTEELCSEMKKSGKAQLIREKTGLLIDPYFSSSKIRWILNQIENGQERAEKGELYCGTVDSWLVYCLSGKKVHISDVSNASRYQLMNLKTLNWDDELCQLWNIPKCMLPEIVSSSQTYGYTDKESLGTEVPICSVIGDQQASLFGQACFNKGDVKNTYGTGCFLLMNIGDTPFLSDNGLVTTVAWKIKDKVQYALEGSVFVAGSAIQWLRDGLKLIKTAGESEDLANSVDSSDGLYVVPAFTGMGAPYWDANARGAVFGITRGTTAAHLTRATLESLAYQTYDVLKAMEQDTGSKITELKVDGGASSNNYLMQFQSDLLQADINRSQIVETTVLGATYLAGLECGIWQNEEEIAERWHNGGHFEAKQSEEEVNELLKGWHTAVEATRMFK